MGTRGSAMALVQSQQLAASGLSNALRPLLFFGGARRFDEILFLRRRMKWTRNGASMRKMLWVLGLLAMTAASVYPQMVPQPDKDGVYSFGKGLTLPKLIHGAEAVYPTDPSLAGIKRVCVMRVVIGADGTPGTVQVINQRPSPFDASAAAAVKQSQFVPGRYQESSVPTYITLWVPFNVAKRVLATVSTPSQKGVSVPVALNSVTAEFPKQARKEKDEGVVVIRVPVTETGLPTNATVEWHAGHGFDENALKAVANYRFKPATLHGVPVPMEIVVEVNFRRD
jgi:TonB family protein